MLMYTSILTKIQISTGKINTLVTIKELRTSLVIFLIPSIVLLNI